MATTVFLVDIKIFHYATTGLWGYGSLGVKSTL